MDICVVQVSDLFSRLSKRGHNREGNEIYVISGITDGANFQS